MSFVNIATYRFLEVPDPYSWQSALWACCDEVSLKGNIVLATEGINLSLAGTRDAIDQFVKFLSEEELFQQSLSNLDIKESLSETQPFRRLVVRIAREIITIRHAMDTTRRAPAVDPATLEKWLDQGCDDEGRELILLDARNRYEYEIGTFEGAVHLDIERFSDFPGALDNALSSGSHSRFPEGVWQDKTFVSFCTGGIRCEKALLYMGERGIDHAFQLDGGILKYFEKVGGTHWLGECFVFDERVAVDPGLIATTKFKLQRKQ